MTAPKSKTTAARLCECIRAAQEAGQTVAAARVDGRVIELEEAIGAAEYDLHSLRYTAAAELLLAGCDDDLIAAVTGQSRRMVEHYTRHVRQRARATEAQRRRTE